MSLSFWIAAYLLCFAGFGWLALAMDAHWRQVRRDRLPALGWRHALRMLGAAALALALAACLAADHATMAVLVWVMLLAAAALSVAFTLSWRPRWLAPLVAWLPA